MDHCRLLIHGLLPPGWIQVLYYVPLQISKKLSSPAMSILRIFHKMSTALLLTFFLSENVASFRLSFGVLLPVIADHFKVGRAEAALISSFMNLLTLGSGRHICAMKSFSFHPF